MSQSFMLGYQYGCSDQHPDDAMDHAPLIEIPASNDHNELALRTPPHNEGRKRSRAQWTENCSEDAPPPGRCFLFRTAALARRVGIWLTELTAVQPACGTIPAEATVSLAISIFR